MCKFLAGLNVAHCNKHNLPLDTNVGITGMIAEDHAALSLLLCEWPDEEPIGDSGLSRTQVLRYILQCLGIENVATLDCDDLSLGDELAGD
jgi:hypothetical protein